MSKKILAALLAVCMIVGLIAVPAFAADDGFTDVAEDHWAAEAIQRWADAGVLTGHGDGTFTPEKQMTRAEFASMLVNMLGLTAKSDETFPDVDGDAWYAEVISIAIKAGILTGDNGNARPNDFVSFNEAVVMMARAFGLKPAADAEDAFPESASWAKDALNALAAMGAISASEDDQINPAMTFDRAAVAAIADKVVEEYVNEDREEPISGEIKGVILVVNNAKVEIKDATLSAPVVVESASVTLTNTKAQDVIVGGTEASVTADEESTVENVTLGGEAPKADIKGEVASVTIAEGATEAVVDAPKAAEDAIVNNSTSEATVNGEAVEGKPEEPAPDEGGEDDENAPGTVQGAGTSAPSHAGDAADDERVSTTTPTGGTANTVTDPTKAQKDAAQSKACSDSESGHTWVKEATGNTEPTCTDTGTYKYKCSTCQATSSVTVAALGHTNKANSKSGITTAPTCTAKGIKSWICANTGCTYVVATEEIAANGHEYTTGVRYDYSGNLHWKVCKYCATADNASRAAHTWNAGTETTPATETATGVKTFTCTACSATKTEVIPKLVADHEGDCEAASAWTTDNNQHWHVCKLKKADGETDCGKVVGTTENHNWGDGWSYNATTGKDTRTCATCSKTETVDHDHSHYTAAEVTAQKGADCQTNGTTAGTKCPKCDAVLTGCEADSSNKGDHNWGNIEVDDPDNAGQKKTIEGCTVCKTPKG